MEKVDLQSIPLWEKITWLLIVAYLVIAFGVFWMFGFSHLPFPV